ncbi:MAG: type I-E CRISPR-associated protein Cse1/CasA [Brevinematales bacterium]|nr:type I-E CRISPR-associated protein Cse1/CasA [Brevinematales bacterium]
MNLVSDPWIPVTAADGLPTIISLLNVFTKGALYPDLSVKPYERVALMRLFTCIAHAALDGPNNFEEWENSVKLLAEKVPSYLSKWKDYFELYHPSTPFLQIAGLNPKSPRNPVSKMDFDIANGNSTTFFDNESISDDVRKIPDDELALLLLTYQCYSLGGGLGVTEWNGTATKQVGNMDAPCSDDSMIHCFIGGGNLLDTIVLNLPVRDDLNKHYSGFDYGKPVWEMYPTSPDPDSPEAENASRTYMGRLVSLSRWIKLIPGEYEMLFGEGFKYPKFPDFPREITSSVRRVKQGKKEEKSFLMPYSPEKALWRDLQSVIIVKDDYQEGGPLCLRRLRGDKDFDLIIDGFARYQQKFLDASEGIYHIPGRMLTDRGREYYEKGIDFAEKRDWRLKGAVKQYYKILNVQADLSGKASGIFWTLLESQKDLLFTIAGSTGNRTVVEGLEKEWHDIVFKTAINAYQMCCENHSARALQAFAIGWRVLTGFEIKDKEDHNVSID